MKFQPLLILFTLYISSQAACNNPLLATLSITGQPTSSVKSGLPYCKSLKDKPTCCSLGTMTNFGQKALELKNRLRTLVIARDTFLYNSLNDLTPRYVQLNADFKTASKNAFAKLEQMTPTQVLSLYTTVNLISDKAFEFENAAATLKTTFSKYQKSRTPCVVRMIKLQAAAWCLACDPDWSTKGVSASATITMASKVCNRIKRACYPFITEANSQSLIAEAKIMLSVYEDLITKLTAIATSGTLPAGGFTYTPTFNPTDSSQKAITVPSTCLSDVTCDYLCTDLLKDGLLNEDLVGVGAGPLASNDLFDNNFFQRLLEEENNSTEINDDDDEEESNNRVMKQHSFRMLQTGEWSPDDDEAGVDSTFEDDPAGIFVYGEIIKPATYLILLIFFIILWT